MELNKYIEYTNLDQTATLKDIEKLCNEAIKNKFAAICVNPYYVPLASSLLKSEKQSFQCPSVRLHRKEKERQK